MNRKLNLGCGEFKKTGYVNVDFFSISKPDIKHNLDIFPYPFHDDFFELVEAEHVLEHLDNPFRAMKEIHRISKKGAEVIIKVPHFSRGFTHPEHKRGFDVSFPYFFDSKIVGQYQGFELGLKKMRMSWMGRYAGNFIRQHSFLPVYWAASVLNFIYTGLANISPKFCSRLWCYWVGGFEEIEYHFIVKKNGRKN